MTNFRGFPVWANAVEQKSVVATTARRRVNVCIKKVSANERRKTLSKPAIQRGSHHTKQSADPAFIERKRNFVERNLIGRKIE
jgi:hypothetical protein